ncbi:MAG: esterase/lipase family protein [Candidatus Binatia bacterium]
MVMTLGDSVVLLHGLGRTHRSLLLTQWRLKAAGFQPINIHYPSRSQPIERLAVFVMSKLPTDTRRTMHFVTHSLGGIVLRYLVSVQRPQNLGRVVMLSPPNRGSRVASRLRNNPIYRFLLGPAGQQIGAEPDSLPNQLGPVTFELGVITGNRPLVALPWQAHEEGDGKVTVSEATVEGMRDFLVVRRGHTFIMNDPRVLDQVIHFLRHGCFARNGSAHQRLH